MKLEVGLYVRTLTLSGFSKIGKLEKIDDICITDNGAVDKNQIIKASHNIIDLIEVGDYVNGKKVIRKWEEPFGEFVGQIFIKLDGEETIPTIRKIETIVTKEQFKSMQYKVGE